MVSLTVSYPSRDELEQAAGLDRVAQNVAAAHEEQRVPGQAVEVHLTSNGRV